MQRKPDGLVPIGEALADPSGPVKAIRDASPRARHHFTQADQGVRSRNGKNRTLTELCSSWSPLGSRQQVQ